MSGPIVGETRATDLLMLQQAAEKRRKYCEGKYSFYEHLDNGVILLAGLTAGLAGVSAVLDAETAVTAISAFASATLTGLAPSIRGKRVHNVQAAADYDLIAWKADQTVKHETCPERRLDSLKSLRAELHVLDRTPAL